jgi:hypothetical protein
MKARYLTFFSGLMALLLVLGGFLLLLPQRCQAGYRIFKIWPQQASSTLKLNNLGQAVWDYTWYPEDTRYIYLYSQGRVEQLSTNSPTLFPDINDKGEVAWQKNFSEQNNEVYLYSGDQIFLLSDDRNPQVPKINNLSQVLWMANGPTNPLKTQLILYNHDGQTITPITDGDSIDLGHEFNDRGEVAWSRVINPDLAIHVICLYSNNAIQEISAQGYFSNPIKINNRTQVLYHGIRANDGNLYLYDSGTGETTLIATDISEGFGYDLNDQGQVVYCINEGIHQSSVYLYDNGVTTKISLLPQFTANHYPRINNRGQVVWAGEDGTLYGQQILLYDAGRVTQVTSMMKYVGRPDINERGEIIFGGTHKVLGAGTYLALLGSMPPIYNLLLD